MLDEVQRLLAASAAELDHPTADELLCAAYTRARLAWALDQPDRDWLPLVLTMTLAPVTLLRLCCEATGQDLPALSPVDILQAGGLRASTFEELAAAEARERAEARARWERRESRTGPNAWQARRRILRTSPPDRLALGLEMGGQQVGDAVKGVLCPECDRRSVWWWIDAQVAHRARCNSSSCGWSAPLHELGQ